jgi:MoaA/NifB/PqqE/SkfB family radical SAM enzyme
MARSHQALGRSGRSELATRRCDLSCAWCESCDNREISPENVQRVLNGPPPNSPVLRVRGGDVFRYADLNAWVAFGRRAPDSFVCLEGPAASLAGEDRAALVARLLDAKPDAIAAVLPTIDAGRTTALTGLSWDPALALESLAALSKAGLVVEVIFPVHPTTVSHLAEVVLAVTERLGDVDVTLRRAPSAQRDAKRLPLLNTVWPELEALSDQLAKLPNRLPGGARLHLDRESGYAACMVRPEGRRPDLFKKTGAGGARPLGEVCGLCAFQARCNWSASKGRPAPEQITPLSPDEGRALDEAPGLPSLGLRPHTFHTPRAPLGLPDLLCLAPWTTLVATEPRLPVVPCALSWVDSILSPEEIAAQMGTPVEEERERAKIAEDEYGGPWYATDNNRLSLMELWNGPLLRRMRREMTGGTKSSRCRSMCRVVMGVEERGIGSIQRPSSELTPEVVRNRDLLLREVNENRHVLTAKPLEMVMSASAHCNISCGFCDGPLGRYGDLSDRRRDEIIEWLPTMMSFGVAGPGEPLMNGNFLKLLGHISDTGYPSLSVSITTNGVLLTPAFQQRHRNVPWGHVRVSLNAGSAETHERMTGKKYFDRVLENIDTLCALRDKAQTKFMITLSFVLSENQMGDLHRFAKIVHDRHTNLVVEPMYGNLRELSPWIRPDRLMVLADEMKSVADDYATKNPDISRAFTAVERFARQRLAGGDFRPLGSH